MNGELLNGIRFFTRETDILSALSAACGAGDRVERAMDGDCGENSVFDLASVTKLFTGLCMMRLKEDAAELIRRLTGKSDGAVVLQKPSPAPEGHDPVNHPSHYTQGGVECIDALKAATTGLEGIEAVCTANAIKYLWRWKQKNGTEDLRKAVWYINRLIGETEG